MALANELARYSPMAAHHEIANLQNGWPAPSARIPGWRGTSPIPRILGPNRFQFRGSRDSVSIALIEPLMPARQPLERPRETELRAMVHALFYLLAASCQWRGLPKDLPRCLTVQGYFNGWRHDGT
jgi:Putative transposase of IS4/5 family (DUF4096)